MKKQTLRLVAAFLISILLSVHGFAAERMLIPGGNTVGIKLHTHGLLVTGLEKDSPAKIAGLRKGDVILEANGESVQTVAALQSALKGSRVVLTVSRGGKEARFCVNPMQTPNGGRIGAYIRDSMSGIGTVTFYDPLTGAFGALGHGVNDRDTSVLIPVESGVVVASKVDQVKKGSDGSPGELKGKFDVNSILGSVSDNTDFGIFGELTTPVPGTPLPVAEVGEVRTGAAKILSNVSGDKVEEFNVRIVEIHPQDRDSGRNLLLRVTDPRLLDRTGGIVQGMSGSPIIQDGKLVGAVTHVLVNDPTRGYGIFIENMLNAAG